MGFKTRCGLETVLITYHPKASWREGVRDKKRNLSLVKIILSDLRHSAHERERRNVSDHVLHVLGVSAAPQCPDIIVARLIAGFKPSGTSMGCSGTSMGCSGTSMGCSGSACAPEECTTLTLPHCSMGGTTSSNA